MITVDMEKCTECGLCARICHEQCIAMPNGSGEKVVRIEQALCSTCTQCIAICPRRALAWDGVQAVRYERDRLPTAQQMAELFKERRTVRNFKERPVARALIAEIVAFGIDAPTNNYELRAIVVDDGALIEALDGIIMGYTRWYYNILYRSPLIFKLLRTLTRVVDEKGKVKIERGLARGSTYEVAPAAVVYIAGDRRILFSEASAQYALYNMILYAQVKGVGSRIKAAGPMALDRDRRARRWLGLQKREHILATVELGYPALRFSNKVQGKKMPVTWKGRGAHD